MLAIYSTSPHPVYASPAVYLVPRRVPVYQEVYLNMMAETLQQRALAIRRAQQEALRLEESRRRQLNALQNNLNRRRLTRSYVLSPIGYIPVQTPTNYSSVWDATNAEDESSALFTHDVKYESEFEALRRRKAHQAWVEHLIRFERENKARTEGTKEVTTLGQTPKDLHAKSLNRNVHNNITHDTPVVIPVKARKIDESDRIRKAAIHNARTRFMESLQALANEFNAEVSNPSDMAKASPAPVSKTPEETTPLHSITPPAENVFGFDNSKPHTGGPKLRRRREIAARTIQRRWRSHSAEVAARKDALNTINALRSRFEFLQSSFIIPEHLEFREDSEKPMLLFSSDNAPVNTYTHELDKLLSLADGVPSAGNESVRSARRAFVKSVEEALEKVEISIRDIWNRQKSSSTAESVFTPIPGSENPPVESTADAISHLVGTSSSILPPKTTMDLDVSTVINEQPLRQGSSSPGRDATAITTSTGDVNTAKVSEAGIVTGSPVSIDISPNAPIASHSEGVHRTVVEANIDYIPVVDVVGTSQLSHSSATSDVGVTNIEFTSCVPSSADSEESKVSVSTGEDNNGVTTEVRNVTELQTTHLPVHVTSDLINNPDLDEEVAVDHANLEAQGDADINVITSASSNGASLPACDLGPATTIPEQCPPTTPHADSSLPSIDKIDIVSESRQPLLSEASNPVADTAGKDRDEDVQISVSSSDGADGVKVVTSEAEGASSRVWEPNLDRALDAVQSVPVELSSPLRSSTTYDSENEDTTTFSNHPSVSSKSNIDDNFDIVYPDSPSSDVLPDVQLDVETTRSSDNIDELEAKSSSAGSDEFELV